MAEIHSFPSEQSENIQQPPKRSSHWQFVIIGILWLALGAFTFWQLPSTSSVIVTWSTETETDNAGFNLYRGEAATEAKADEDCTDIAQEQYVQVNNQLIAAKGGAVSGSSYSFPDTSAEPDKHYCYQLEDVELSGRTERHTPFFGTAPRLLDRILYIILAPVSLLVGTALIISGIKGSRQNR